jgi:hypothetical protein
MDPTSFSPFTGWLTVFYLVRWSTGALGADAVPTSVQNDPHFMGWYIAPTTSKQTDSARQGMLNGADHIILSNSGLDGPGFLEYFWELRSRLFNKSLLRRNSL